ncbi:MAG: hypothetical protein KAI45_13795 [Melioribacteraceae bacterium]|nr:hypothetical protein [Melioribacteraceae bacterium]
MKISLEEIISLVVKEVIAELAKKGIQVDGENNNFSMADTTKQKVKMDFKEYKTPLLTEARILELDSEVVEIEVPVKTIVTPSAQDLIRKRNIIITKK